MDDVTLQINLSAGDLSYARLTVPRLVESHHGQARERVAVVDCCPRRTQRGANAVEFAGQVEQLRALAEELRAEGYFDRLVYVQPGSELFPHLAKRYTNNLVHETHDYQGYAVMAYLAAL